MRLVSFAKNGTSGAGILHKDGILPLFILGYDDAIAFMAAGEQARAKAESQLRKASSAELLPLSSVHLLAPVPRPPKILCVGLNYRDHAVEAKMEIPAVPAIFIKLSTAVVGPDEPIVVPAFITKPDYEAEFAVVIGKGGSRIPRDRWQEHVFGYTILNDVSARDVQLATSQWTMGKSLNSFAPIGPHIVTVDEIPDPHALDIRLSIGGETLQHSNTRELIFRVPELVEYISRLAPLEPGDVISTGTPSGVGLGRTPNRWLRAGDEIVIEIEKIGALRNPVIAEAS
jgi:2-keto-4-pentenoate hydratase/2-oxohepta-3-ene-1,7-dioic acid hydratase in catechol pathway